MYLFLHDFVTKKERKTENRDLYACTKISVIIINPVSVYANVREEQYFLRLLTSKLSYITGRLTFNFATYQQMISPYHSKTLQTTRIKGIIHCRTILKVQIFTL